MPSTASFRARPLDEQSYCSEPIGLARVEGLQEILACATVTRLFEMP